MGPRAQKLGDAAYQGLNVDRGVIEFQLPGLEPGVVEQVVDQTQKMLCG